MNRKVNMFCGHSGVGKSTLLNSISPNLNVKTSKISEVNNSGKHTTTFAEMFDIENQEIEMKPGETGGVIIMIITSLISSIYGILLIINEKDYLYVS